VKTHLLLVTSVLLAGCSNAPSSSDITKALENTVGPCHNVEIVDVKKTNGYQEDGLYRVEYKAGLKVKEKGELKKLYDTWRDEYVQFETNQKAYNELEARIAELMKEADAVAETVGPRPVQSDFAEQAGHLQFNAYMEASSDWRKRRDDATRGQMQEIEELRQKWGQREPTKFVIVGKESELGGKFFYKGCPLQAMKYVRAAIPEMPRDSYGMLNPEILLLFERAELTGEMNMRKTENGWQKI